MIVELPTLDLDFFRSCDPCCDPEFFLGSGWTGSILDVMQHENIRPCDKFWAFTRTNVCPDWIQQLVLIRLILNAKMVDGTEFTSLLVDQRLVDALFLAEGYALGYVTRNEVNDALENVKSAVQKITTTTHSAKNEDLSNPYLSGTYFASRAVLMALIAVIEWDRREPLRSRQWILAANTVCSAIGTGGGYVAFSGAKNAFVSYCQTNQVNSVIDTLKEYTRPPFIIHKTSINERKI